jgi:hypothetical protein
MASNADDTSPVEVARSLKGIDLPAGKQEVVDHTRRNGAEQAVLKLLERLPDRQYRTMAEVEKGVGEVR